MEMRKMPGIRGELDEHPASSSAVVSSANIQMDDGNV